MKYFHLIILGPLITLVACNTNDPFKGISFRQYDNLSAFSINAKLTQAGPVTLSIWQENTADTARFTAKPTSGNVEFRLPLAPGEDYCFQLSAESESGIVKSLVECLSMAVAPVELPQFEVSSTNEYTFEGGILLKKYGSPAAHYMINSAGKIIWYHLADSMPEKSFSLVNENELLTLPSTREILRLTFAGDTLAEFFSGREMDREVHHDALLTHGKTVALTYEYKSYDFSTFGGAEADSVKGDGILVLDEKGREVWHWSIFDNNAPPVSGDLYKARIDYGHANAITVAPDSNFLVSFRDFNQIWKIDAETGKVLWKLGDSGDFPLLPEQYFKKQHAIHYDKSGNLVIFDNIAGNRSISRILFFNLNEPDKTVENFRQLKLPKELYSFKQASAYQLSDSTYLVASSMKNKLAIVDLTGNLLWQAQSSETFYRAYFVNDVDF